jgi:chromosome partitioning protein
MDYIVHRGYNDHNVCTVHKAYRTYKVYNDYKGYNEINKNKSIMIILFTNIKGGVGKTSTCALFAQYLYECGYPVMALDADIQASLSRHRERELAANPEVAVPWEVSTIDTTDRQSLQSSIKEAMQFDGVVLFDMPGTLNAANLDLLYKAADLAVVPISYDFDTIDATGIFIKVIKRVKNIQLVFLPNRINSTENRADDIKQREETVKILGRIGRVTPRIKQSVVIKRYSTVSALDKYQKAAVEHAFNAIIEHIKL